MKLQYKVISKFYGLLDFFYFNNINSSPRRGILEFIPNKKMKILEVCMGTAENSIIIADNRPKLEIIGIDLSNDMLEIAEKKIKMKGIRNIKTLVMDATSLKFDDNSFDIVIISLVLHEVDEHIKYRILTETKRVLKHQGKLLVIEWDKPQKLIHKLLFSIIILLEPKGFKKFLESNIKEYLEKFSLKVMSEKKCDYTRIIEITKGN